MSLHNDLITEYLPDNVMDRLARVERQVRELMDGEVTVSKLSLISDDIGEIEHGILAFGEGDIEDPESATNPFTGVGMGFPGWLLQGTTWGIIGVNAGVLQFGVSVEDGKLYAAGGAMVVDQDAISVTGLNYSITHTAENEGETRVLRIGQAIPADGTTPMGEISFTGEATGSELAVNGDFETGALSNWTKTTETNGSWTADTATVHDGSKAAKFTPTATDTVGELTSDRITVTATDAYLLSFWAYVVSSANVWDWKYVKLLWYDHASAGNLLKTDYVPITAVTNQWVYQNATKIAPAGALSVAIKVHGRSFGHAGAPGAISVDDISLIETDVARSITFRPNVSLDGPLQLALGSASAADDGYGSYGAGSHGEPVYGAGNSMTLGWGLGGQPYNRKFVNNSTTPLGIYSSVIPAGLLVTGGFIELSFFVWIFNDSGAGRTFTIDVNYGGSSVFSATTTNIASDASDRYGHLVVKVINNNSVSSQRAWVYFYRSPAGAQDTLHAIALHEIGYGSAAVDSTVDQTLEITITLSAAHASYSFMSSGAAVIGPFGLQ